METDPITNPVDGSEFTDIYGRKISDLRQSHFRDDVTVTDTDAEDESDTQITKRLEGSLGTQQKIEGNKEKDEQVILTYAEKLHKGLRVMWVPMVYLGRLPFRLILKNNRAYIVVNKRSPAYISCLATCVLTWIVFLWITLGILLIVGHNPSSQIREFARYYWTDTFIFWTTLLQACVSTLHVLRQADEFAMFIKAWYRVLDITKIEVSKTLKQYIISSQIILCLFILGMVTMFCLPKMFDDLQGTTWMIVIALREPIDFFLQRQRNHIKEIQFSRKFSPVGLVIYLFAIVFSWMYIMQFMVFCRCFRTGLKCINERIAMILNVDDVQRVGPNALRLTYEYIHKDYLGIATTGIKIGNIFSWTMCNYYLWAILVLVVELGEIFRLAKSDYRNKQVQQSDPSASTFSGQQDKIPIPIQQIINELLHFVVTTFCIFYVSYEGSHAHQEGKMGYELARYKGLVDCTTQLERNFIRSIWIIVSEKCPVHVAPGKYFGITHSTVMTVFATAFTYFVFWAQSQGKFTK